MCRLTATWIRKSGARQRSIEPKKVVANFRGKWEQFDNQARFENASRAGLLNTDFNGYFSLLHRITATLSCMKSCN
jgi:hypothetical protein